MGLEDKIAAFYKKASESLSSSIDSIFDWCCHNRDIASLYLAGFSGAAGYALASKAGMYNASFFAVISASFAGLFSYFYLRDEKYLRKLGVSRDSIKRKITHFVSDKPFLVQLWNSPFEHSDAWSIIPVSYVLANSGAIILVPAVYLASVLTLKSLGGFLHSDSMPVYYDFYLKLKNRFEPKAYFSKAESLAAKSSLSWIHFNLVERYDKEGFVKEAYSHLRKIEEGIVLPEIKPPLMFGGSGLVAGIFRLLDSNPSRITYLYSAELLRALESSNYLGLIEEMTQRYKSAETELISFWFLKESDPEIARMHLKNALDLAIREPDVYSMERLSERPGGKSFRFSPSHLKDDFAIRTGSMESLQREFNMTSDVRRILDGMEQYPPVEPLLVCSVDGRTNVFLRLQKRGETLHHYIISGEAGLDDLLYSWNLTEIIHKGYAAIHRTRKGLSAREKLHQSLSKPYLGLSEKDISDLMSLGDVIDAYSSDDWVINTDGKPKNRIESSPFGSSASWWMTPIDFQPMGWVRREYEAATLYRDTATEKFKAVEPDFLKEGKIDELPYYLNSFVKICSLIGWSFHFNVQYALEKIADGKYDIAQIQNAAPIFYGNNRAGFENASRCLEKLSDRLAA